MSCYTLDGKQHCNEIRRPATPPVTQIACNVNNWRYRKTSIGHTIIEGTSTCASGKITIRAFDPKGTWLGNGDGYIEAHAFTVYISNLAAPAKMSIKYAIE